MSELKLKTFTAFEKRVKGPWQWNGKPGEEHHRGYVDIQTDYVELSIENTIATVGLVHWVGPGGRVFVQITGKEVVGDTSATKRLRINFQVMTHGNPDMSIVEINFFGLIFGGASGDQVDFGELP